MKHTLGCIKVLSSRSSDNQTFIINIIFSVNYKCNHIKKPNNPLAKKKPTYVRLRNKYLYILFSYLQNKIDNSLIKIFASYLFACLYTCVSNNVHIVYTPLERSKTTWKNVFMG